MSRHGLIPPLDRTFPFQLPSTADSDQQWPAEQSKYSRTSGVDFGPVDIVKYAEAFGAVGLMVDTPDQIGPSLKKAFEIPGPVLIGIRVDYRDNHKLFEKVHERLFN